MVTMLKKARKIVIIDRDRCNPNKCPYNCMHICPPQRAGKEVFTIDDDGYPVINEDLCIGCGLCVKAVSYTHLRAHETEADLV